MSSAPYPSAAEIAEALHLLRTALLGPPAATLAPAAPAPRRITLDQAAALVHRSKRTLEKYRRHRRHPLPWPTVEGGGGHAAQWDWDVIRPWLETVFRCQLPADYPS